jgi:hypothetical protein
MPSKLRIKLRPLQEIFSGGGGFDGGQRGGDFLHVGDGEDFVVLAPSDVAIFVDDDDRASGDAFI